jgi:hypothetical protein
MPVVIWLTPSKLNYSARSFNCGIAFSALANAANKRDLIFAIHKFDVGNENEITRRMWAKWITCTNQKKNVMFHMVICEEIVKFWGKYMEHAFKTSKENYLSTSDRSGG